MKKIIFITSALLIFNSCKQEKIGFVDNGEVINAYQEKVDLESKYEEKNNILQKRIDSIRTVLQTDAQEFQLKAQSMTEAQAQQKYQELASRQQRLSAEIQQQQQEMQQAFQTEIDTLIVKVKEFVSDYGKNNGYTYILGTSDAFSSVMYGKEEYDLSQVIIDALNESYKKD